MQNITKQTYSTYSLISNTYLFTGREYEAESGLYYYRARHYSPVFGRFLQRDPIGIWEDETNLGNGYSYVGNNGVNWTDAMGLYKNSSVVCNDMGLGRCLTIRVNEGLSFVGYFTAGGLPEIGIFIGAGYVAAAAAFCACDNCSGGWLDIMCFWYSNNGGNGNVPNKCSLSNSF